ncbi:MAG: BLUF domain-containing protein [Deltaproteobacteria bacterium]|nr:BLUF domain-containing protein [Deltaproteobacteria bacterium]
MERLIHLIYASSAQPDFSPAEVTDVLKRSRGNNAALDVTGMLLYADGSFFQVLEGPEEVVDALFEKICEDPRHGKLVKIIREPIATRAFADWSMGYSKMTRGELGEVPGLNDFFSRGSCLEALDPGRAKRLLEAFASGRWRNRIRSGAASVAHG